jgi:hypothetical protein
MRCIIFILALLLGAGCDPMPSKVTIKSERKSPDGKYVATAFIRDSGATTSWSPQVDLRPVGQRMDKYGNVFMGYGSPNVDTEWSSSSNLVIYCDTNCTTDLFVSNYHGVFVQRRHLK